MYEVQQLNYIHCSLQEVIQSAGITPNEVEVTSLNLLTLLCEYVNNNNNKKKLYT